MTTNKIILTDWPKTEQIEPNYRGLETEELKKLERTMFHLMMPCWSDSAGGYVIVYTPKGVREELEFRGVKEYDGRGSIEEEKDADSE